MYRVLIIDDEEPLRDAIRILGDWKALGVAEILEATNGKDGLALLEQQQIDLVMVDMKMPEMDGVQFLQIIERDYPELFAIVISGYNDFEYTRQAIRAKVVDYLLKPINRADLNQALSKAIGVLEARRKTQSEFITKNITLNMSLPKLKEKIYLSIIERTFKKSTNEAFLPLIGADEAGSRFGAIVLRIMNLERILEARFNSDIGLLQFAVANVLGDAADDIISCFSFANPKQEREMTAVYTVRGGSSEGVSFRSTHLVRHTAEALEKLFGMRVVSAIGTDGSDVMHIADSYDSARAAISGIDLLKLSGSMMAGKAGQAGSGELQSIAGRMPLIRGALDTGNFNQARSMLVDLMKQLQSADRFTLGEADRMLHEFVLLLGDLARERGAVKRNQPEGEQLLRSVGIVTDFVDFAQYEAAMSRILSFYSDAIRQSLTADRPFDIAEIKAYIDQFYFEDIKISMFTEKYFLSREYLMKLFKQQFGYGIHEYVQKIRMDKAKMLLGDPSLKIQEISEMLGYKDKNYFSKAFRNYYHFSPSEYRSIEEADKK